MRRGSSASRRAQDAVVSYIREHHLSPGSPLPSEAVLCAELGCSRSALREAMRTLVSLDVVEVRHGHGTYVSQVSMAPLIESMVLRVLLDSSRSIENLGHVVELRQLIDHSLVPELIEAWRGADLNPLIEIVEQMRTRRLRGEPFTEEDERFHTLLLERIPNPVSVELALAFWSIHMRLMDELGVSFPEEIGHVVEAHAAIVRALQAGDAERLRTYIDAHYRPLLGEIARATPKGR